MFLKRRHILAGGAGALLALPWLAGRARSVHAATPPRRLVIFFTPNGTVHHNWLPTGTEHDFALSTILAPLAPHQEDIIVLDGIDMESSYHGPGDASHWNGMGHMLTGSELIEPIAGEFTGGGISVDQYIADHVGGETYLPSLELTLDEQVSFVGHRMSYRAAAEPVPPIADPAIAFERAFGEVPPLLADRRRMVLGAVGEDLAAFARKLGRDDRRRLEAHQERIHSIVQRLDLLPDLSACDVVVPPALDAHDPKLIPQVSRLQMDLLVQALACDVTRIASFQWSIAQSNVWHSWVGAYGSHHDISHRTDKDALDHLTAINTWLCGEFAYLLSAMKSVEEDGGTLLDNSIVLWCNELGEGSAHTRRSVPFVLAGSCGGQLVTGRFLRYGESGVQPHNDLLVSLCRLMGLDVSTFGNPTYCNGPLPQLARRAI